MKKNAFISVNFAVLLFGLAGLFAKWIRLPALTITFGRVLFSSIALGLFMLFRKQSFRINTRRDTLLLIGAGMILAVHWWSFLAAIQLSTVAIGTITFSAFPLFVTFLEPMIFHFPLKRRNVFLALLILIGVFITIPEFTFENSTFSGIMLGLVTALTYAVLTLMNKIFTGNPVRRLPSGRRGPCPAAVSGDHHYRPCPYAVHLRSERAACAACGYLLLNGDRLRDPFCFSVFAGNSFTARAPRGSSHHWRCLFCPIGF